MKRFLGTWVVCGIVAVLFLSLVPWLFSMRNSGGPMAGMAVVTIIPTIMVNIWLAQEEKIEELEKRIEKLEQKPEEATSTDI